MGPLYRIYSGGTTRFVQYFCYFLLWYFLNSREWRTLDTLQTPWTVFVRNGELGIRGSRVSLIGSPTLHLASGLISIVFIKFNLSNSD